MNDSVILQRIELGTPWPTIDPFLFCVHHLDHYPSANGEFGPAASLQGRSIGNDFANVDGWNMYHGAVVPGFPQHPHRGFETLTFVRRGLVDHADSLGAAARYGRGDAQWMTAGSGIVHSEMFPLLDEADGADNTLELFQIWVNLASTDKMTDPHFSMLWDEDIPKIEQVDDAGRRSLITVVAGGYAGATPPSPPPASWASKSDSDVAVWHVVLEDGASIELPAAAFEDAVRTLYLFQGSSLDLSGEDLSGYVGSVIDSQRSVTVTATDGPAEFLVLQGRPIGEPVAQYGPFVMNTRAEVAQAFEDYQTTQFGGWPWPSPDPVHGGDEARFARRPDGEVETPLGGEPVEATV